MAFFCGMGSHCGLAKPKTICRLFRLTRIRQNQYVLKENSVHIELVLNASLAI